MTSAPFGKPSPLRRCLRPLHVCAIAAAIVSAGAPTVAADLPAFDFVQPGAVAEWRPNRHVQAIEASPEGLVIDLAGDDPYVTGPPRDYPADLPLRMTMRVRPDVDGMVQVFHFHDRASEERSIAFPVRAGQWNDVRAILPPLGPGCRLRIDPPGRAGRAVVARIGFEPAAPLPAPQWPAHEAFDTSTGRSVESGPLSVAVAPQGFSVAVDGHRVAASHSRQLAGYVIDGQVRWVSLDAPATVRAAEGDDASRPALESVQSIRDGDGGTWRIRKRFTAGRVPGAIDLQVTVDVDADRDLAFLPLVLLVAHEGSPHKQQAVFPGLEYLADEPSSSEADLVGPQSRRQVPASHKIAFPLQAVAAEGRVVGLAWEHGPTLAAVFDSPNRILGGGGHLLGVIAPGSDGLHRHEGDLLPIDPVRLHAGETITLRATISGAHGDTVVPALRSFVETRGLPEVPDVGGLPDYVNQASAGWLDSGIRDGGRYRHAIGANFPFQPAADAAAYTHWLAGVAADPALRRRLDDAAATALEQVPVGTIDDAWIGHVRLPMQSLVFGRVDEAVAGHAATARRLLATVRPDGTVAYRPSSGGIDYGRTHTADHAVGLSAHAVAGALEAARFTGDGPLIDEAVAALRRLRETYAAGVPRGAQTWEVPLHTPDVLASAHLVRAFTIGHELTGDRELLDEAVAWAWTGLPFIYLVPPVGTPDGPYGCVTVFGATAWKWPVWIGRPVQWCGLVYAHALYRLAKHDPAGPWRRVADGITATGIRYSWPPAGPDAHPDAVERQGLLPDGFDVLEVFRIDPPVNPGTLQVCAVELFGRGPLLDCRVLPFADGLVIIHAPGPIEPASLAAQDAADVEAAQVQFTVRGWPRRPHDVLVTGLREAPEVTIDGSVVAIAPPHRFDADSGRLVLRLDAPRTISLRRR